MHPLMFDINSNLYARVERNAYALVCVDDGVLSFICNYSVHLTVKLAQPAWIQAPIFSASLSESFTPCSKSPLFLFADI